MSIFKRRQKISPEEMARMLYQEVVCNTEVPKQLSVSAERISSYQRKMFLYQLSLVLMALMSEEKKNAKFASVLGILESYVFPPSPTKESAALLTSVRAAMGDLSDLLTRAERPTVLDLVTGTTDPNRSPSDVNQYPELDWAWAWLHDIGIEEHDPFALILLANWWKTSFIMVVRIVRDFKLV